MCILSLMNVDAVHFGSDVNSTKRMENYSCFETIFVFDAVFVLPGAVFEGRMRRRFVDLKLASVKIGPIQGGDDGPGGGAIGHLHKAKAAALVGLLVETDAGADDCPIRFDEFGQAGRFDAKGQVAEI